MTKPIRKIKLKFNAYLTMSDIIENAVERGLNRHDKYSDDALSEHSRSLLHTEIEQSFWLAASDAYVKFI
jgi:hypothetical protein